MSVDPLADKFTEWSPYHYATNNPINIIDYDGRDTMPSMKSMGKALVEGVVESTEKLVNIFKEDTGVWMESKTGRGGNKTVNRPKKVEKMDPPGGARGVGVGDAADKNSSILDYLLGGTMEPAVGWYDQVEEIETEFYSVKVVPTKDTIITVDKTVYPNPDTLIIAVLQARGKLRTKKEFKILK